MEKNVEDSAENYIFDCMLQDAKGPLFIEENTHGFCTFPFKEV